MHNNSPAKIKRNQVGDDKKTVDIINYDKIKADAIKKGTPELVELQWSEIGEVEYKKYQTGGSKEQQYHENSFQ